MVVGLALVPLVAGAGLAIDSARAFVVEARLGKALDAAGLAAGRVVFEDRMQDDARAYFAANYPNDLLGSDIRPGDIEISVDQNDEFITLTATTAMPTTFMRALGYDTVDVAARSVIQRVTRGAEVALVMDNTGSMDSGEMSAMKGAAQDLVDVVFGDQQRYDKLWFSLIPYTSTVNVGTGNAAWVSGMPNYDPTTWKGCVEARWQTGRDATDDPPSSERFRAFFYPSTEPLASPADGNEWSAALGVDESQDAKNDGYGPNLGCGPAITPLTRERSEITAAIDQMQAWHRGGTTSNLGLVWGWRTISPRWRGVWPGSVWPVGYDDDTVTKVVVILTDGENQFYDCQGGGSCGPEDQFVSDYTAYGRLGEDFMPAATDEADGLATLDSKFADACRTMKQQGIVMYTITFGSGASSAAIQTLFRTCASDPGNYFHAPDNGDLADAFRAIGQDLANLRIVE
jgi:Flp pilus assembly protein TadG